MQCVAITMNQTEAGQVTSRDRFPRWIFFDALSLALLPSSFFWFPCVDVGRWREANSSTIQQLKNMQFCHVIAVHEEDGQGCALFVLGLHVALEVY